MAKKASRNVKQSRTVKASNGRAIPAKAGHMVTTNVRGNVILRSTTPAKNRSIAREKLILSACGE